MRILPRLSALRIAPLWARQRRRGRVARRGERKEKERKKEVFLIAAVLSLLQPQPHSLPPSANEGGRPNQQTPKCL
jgi:hypothetical protein